MLGGAGRYRAVRGGERQTWRLSRQAKPEVILRVGRLVPINALVLTGLANFGVVGYPETEPHRRRLTSFLESEISQSRIRLLLPFLP
jgi:hypothetical protein